MNPTLDPPVTEAAVRLNGRDPLHSHATRTRSTLSEERAFQDVEPVTLDCVVVPGCPPGPTLFSSRRPSCVVDEVPVDAVC